MRGRKEEVQINVREVKKIFSQNPRKDFIQLVIQRKKLGTQYQNTEMYMRRK